MALMILLPFFVQTLVILIDEFYFHIKRGLPKWERIGHPIDTLTVLVCFAFILFVPYSSFYLQIYVGLAIFSCLFVTKDEFIHKECCPASEQWLHALLFLNHPIFLTAAGLIWPIANGAVAPSWLGNLSFYSDTLRVFLIFQTGFIALFFIYQILYWNVYYGRTKLSSK
jgi:hypothetical protein